jgi:hypothetical protein
MYVSPLLTDFHWVGAAVGPHPQFGFCCVMDLATEVVSLEHLLREDLVMSLKSIEDLEHENIVKLFLTVPHSVNLKAEIKQHLLAQDEVNRP